MAKTRTAVTSSKALLSGDDQDKLMQFIGKTFDDKTRGELSTFLKGDVKVRGRRGKRKKTEVIDMRERSRIENPAFSVVEATYGAYNPETISVDTFNLMKKDPQVSAGLAFIKLPIIALPWRVECDNVDIEKFVEYTLKRVWRRLVRSSLTAVEYGFASHERVYKIEDINVSSSSKAKSGKKETHFKGNALIYEKIKPHYPDSVTINIDKYDNVVGVSQTPRFGKDITLSKNKLFLFTHDEEFGNPFGRSRLVAAYKYWYWKELMYQFMLMYFERRGAPPVIATAPLGSSTDKAGNRRQNLDVALDLAASLLSNSVAVLPYQADKNTNENMWALDYLLDDKRGEMFIQAINHLDVAILRALWMPESTVSEGGNYGQTSVHADLFLMSEKGLIADFEDAINQQLIPTLVQANFRPKDISDCNIEMESLDFNRKIALKEMFLEIMRNMDNMVQIGMRPKVFPDIEKMASILQIPISTLEDEVDISDVDPNTDPNADPNINKIDPEKKPTAKVIPIDGLKTKAVPRRSTRTSSKGSREVDRKVIRPGGKRADQMRGAGRLTEKQIKKLATMEGDTSSIIEAFYVPSTGEEGGFSDSDRLKISIMHGIFTDEGIKEVKKGLLRLKIWSQADLIPGFESMEAYDLVRAMNGIADFYIDILGEAMERKLSEL